tara:strand:+ start:6349 stop:7083 length:735 start_codon:yes stop_codon:yes gene_type:complete
MKIEISSKKSIWDRWYINNDFGVKIKIKFLENLKTDISSKIKLNLNFNEMENDIKDDYREGHFGEELYQKIFSLNKNNSLQFDEICLPYPFLTDENRPDFNSNEKKGVYWSMPSFNTENFCYKDDDRFSYELEIGTHGIYSNPDQKIYSSKDKEFLWEEEFGKQGKILETGKDPNFPTEGLFFFPPKKVQINDAYQRIADIYLSEVWKKEKKIIDDFLMKNFNLEEDENGIFFYKGNVKCVEKL